MARAAERPGQRRRRPRAARTRAARARRPTTADEGDDGGESSSSRRRRRRRRSGEDGGGAGDDPQNTVTKVRKTRSAEDQITSVTGSTRLEAKKQRRREGREAGRRRAPIVSEAEFLARRESVDRVMAIRQRDDLTQIAVLEDKVLVEHYVARESQTSLIGNVYLGRVQNVLPSMEAAFIDIGKGRNAVLYAGEVNWSALGHKDGQPRKIESVLSLRPDGAGAGHQGPRRPQGRPAHEPDQPGRPVPGLRARRHQQRHLPQAARHRAQPAQGAAQGDRPGRAGVIVRTAAEGASEDELTRDVERLTARWADIEKKVEGQLAAAALRRARPHAQGRPRPVHRGLREARRAGRRTPGRTVQDYVTHVAPDLEERLEEYDGSQADLFTTYRIDEQIHKGLDRKVWLPSGGSLIIDRTEAMTVVDVNTGKFTGSGGNLEETVTKNNLEAAEEMVRQLRLRDIGGIIVVDFIDMVLESNRDLVLRRLVECLGRDRTRHQVAEVTSLGLVQMTRKRIGTGLLEAFSENCEHCSGRGLIVADAPIEPTKEQESKRGSRRSRGGHGRGDDSGQQDNGQAERQAAVPQGRRRDGTHAEVRRTRLPSPSRPRRTEPRGAHETEEPNGRAGRAHASPSGCRKTDEPAAVEPAETPEPAPVMAAAPVREAPEATPEPAAPKVVTRTRRRSASRPAGPPATTVARRGPARLSGDLGRPVGQPPADGAVEPGTAEAEPGPAGVEHVPVKKRGSRKR